MSTDFASPLFKPAPTDYTIIHLSMLGHSVKDISGEVGKPMAYIKGLLGSPWGQDQITNFHTRFMEMLQQRTFEPNAAFYDKLKEKIELLDGMTKSENPSVALRALELWINHTIGAPVKRTEVKVEGSIAHASIEELRFIRDHGRLPSPQERISLAAPSIDADYTSD